MISGGSETILGSPSTFSVSFVNAFMLSFVRAFAAAASTFAACFCGALLPDRLLDGGDVEPRVPDLEVRHRREPPHPLAVFACDAEHDLVALRLREVAVAAADLEARGESLHVPFERAGQRLVEVVEVEDEVPLGRRVAADVGEMRVAAELRLEPDARRRREIVRHDRGRAAVERERRDEHAAVADRHELGTRDGAWSIRICTGSRSAISSKPAWLVRGTSARAALPRAARSAAVKWRTSGGACSSVLSITLAITSSFEAGDQQSLLRRGGA